MNFQIVLQDKILIFDSEVRGLLLGDREFFSGRDGRLIYDQVASLSSDKVRLQMSTNTSTLIPGLKILGLSYPGYFDEREVVESQNDITFYWKKSKLAAFYNLFSTDDLEFEEREPVIREAVNFLINKNIFDLTPAFLSKLLEPSKLLGFYQGWPIFESGYGMPKLLCRLGIHVGQKIVMISTPMEKYEKDVYELAELLKKLTDLDYISKKNRVVFKRNQKLMSVLLSAGF